MPYRPSAPRTACQLKVLDDDVEARVTAIRQEHPDWPCAAGCSACCRALAAPMALTEAEWIRLERTMEALPDRANVRARLSEWTADVPDARTCKFLDTKQGLCRVYAARPVDCRTYGYYVAADGEGRWCGQIQARPDLDAVVWGHEGSLDRRRGWLRLTYSEWRKLGRPPHKETSK